MKRILRASMAVIGSIVLSTLASWGLRRLLSSATGEDQGAKRSGSIIVVLPVFAGNQWVFGQPKQVENPKDSVSDGQSPSH